MKNHLNGSNLTTVKLSNRSLVLRVLNTLGEVSRAELSRITGLTKMTITNIINELIETGIANETGLQDSSSGRKPILIKLSKDARNAIGIYIARDFIHFTITNLKGEIIREIKHQLSKKETTQTFLTAVKENLYILTQDLSLEPSNILGIGVASIGPVDIKNGVVLNPPNFKGLQSIPIVEELEKEFSLNTFLDNDMNASALAEKLYGRAKDLSNFIYIGVTNGVGAGIFLDNKIFTGINGFAGEIGHTTVDMNGEQCPCGNIGCLELYANINNVVSSVRNAQRADNPNYDAVIIGVKWLDIIDGAKNKDALCLKAINDLVYYLSIGIVNTINTFDPEMVFLGHEIALAGDLILAPLNERVNQRLLFRSSKKIHIEMSSFGEYAPSIGAPSIVLNRFFNGSLT